jgi:hypothetical protein
MFDWLFRRREPQSDAGRKLMNVLNNSRRRRTVVVEWAVIWPKARLGNTNAAARPGNGVWRSNSRGTA